MLLDRRVYIRPWSRFVKSNDEAPCLRLRARPDPPFVKRYELIVIVHQNTSFGDECAPPPPDRPAFLGGRPRQWACKAPTHGVAVLECVPYRHERVADHGGRRRGRQRTCRWRVIEEPRLRHGRHRRRLGGMWARDRPHAALCQRNAGRQLEVSRFEGACRLRPQQRREDGLLFERLCVRRTDRASDQLRGRRQFHPQPRLRRREDRFLRCAAEHDAVRGALQRDRPAHRDRELPPRAKLYGRRRPEPDGRRLVSVRTAGFEPAMARLWRDPHRYN